MKKGVTLIIGLLLLQTVMAVDMTGKFGMGIGWNAGLPSSGSMLPNTGITKLGIRERIILEPVLSFMRYSESYAGSSQTTTYFSLMALMDYAILSHEKTNVYLKGGIKFSSLNPPSSFGESTTEFGLPIGFGLEHFVSDHFAVDLSAVSGLSSTSQGDVSSTIFALTNQIIVLGLMWYY